MDLFQSEAQCWLETPSPLVSAPKKEAKTLANTEKLDLAKFETQKFRDAFSFGLLILFSLWIFFFPLRLIKHMRGRNIMWSLYFSLYIIFWYSCIYFQIMIVLARKIRICDVLYMTAMFSVTKNNKNYITSYIKDTLICRIPYIINIFYKLF